MTAPTEITIGDGERRLRAYDSGGAARLTVYWHHGTPNTGTPPEPLFTPGVRWISHDRPGYGGSMPLPGRSVASVVADVMTVADHFGLERFVVLGHSGGGPHALACAALLPDRVSAAAVISSPAPCFPGFFAGMADGAAAGLRAALAGRPAKEAFEASPPPDADIGFAPADFAALSAEWSWFGPVVRAGSANGPGPLIDDDLAYVTDWGFDPATITVPTLLMAGAEDRMIPPAHAAHLADLIPGAELRVVPDEGHVSVLRHGSDALDFLTH